MILFINELKNKSLNTIKMHLYEIQKNQIQLRLLNKNEKIKKLYEWRKNKKLIAQIKTFLREKINGVFL